MRLGKEVQAGFLGLDISCFVRRSRIELIVLKLEVATC